MNKTMTMEEFMAGLNPVSKPIRADGYWSSCENQWDVNYSSILTRLIQSAGRFCKNYASDLFIDWMNIESQLTGENTYYEDKYEYLFGMRKQGVDHASYILSNANNGKCLSDYYSEIFKLTVKVVNDNITMELVEVH